MDIVTDVVTALSPGFVEAIHSAVLDAQKEAAAQSQVLMMRLFKEFEQIN